MAGCQMGEKVEVIDVIRVLGLEKEAQNLKLMEKVRPRWVME